MAIKSNLFCEIERDGELCGQSVYANGVCKSHYMQFRRTGIFEHKHDFIRKNSRLTEDQVKEIKITWRKHHEYMHLANQTTVTAIAKKFGVTKQLVSLILRDRIYKKIILEPEEYIQ
jgi:hypothetical protein